ncbi:helix-turn-helix domain-containing protein [Vallitalea pronyensis]|uniref:Helix-turn-helix domain-containing protein n=1 Tax=Vallitalea pronyensis TaxID=1348613 RepID=A0A8J8MMG3_9FIRM|nr:sugar diacid recognition domain-containing protein [Vallitalea pronyensis]QUI24186.1 helix-turn-helix domain-containing protein [Vallitalea pronyensis]
MVLNQELAQKLVDQIMDNLGYNINIMNDLGVIIASGSKERIGKYHKIAEEVIKKKCRIDIDEEDEAKYEGVKQGINMPFYYQHAIAGVIGITGSPKELENTAELVRMSTELMLEQQALKERIYHHQSQKTFFINRLLAVHYDYDWETTKNWGAKLGYNLTIPRVVCLLSLNNLNHVVETSPLLTKEKVKEHIISSIKATASHNKQDISSYINVDEIIIFKTFKQDENHLKEHIEGYFIEIQKALEGLHVEWSVSVGNYHPSQHGYAESYREAKLLLNNAKQKGKQIIFAKDHIFELLFASVHKGLLDTYLKPLAEKILDSQHMFETIEALIENNMSLVHAAKALYIHRNTMIFRMNKLKEYLNLNPIHNEKDRMLLHVIYLYIKHYKS